MSPESRTEAVTCCGNLELGGLAPRTLGCSESGDGSQSRPQTLLTCLVPGSITLFRLAGSGRPSHSWSMSVGLTSVLCYVLDHRLGLSDSWCTACCLQGFSLGRCPLYTSGFSRVRLWSMGCPNLDRQARELRTWHVGISALLGVRPCPYSHPLLLSSPQG